MVADTPPEIIVTARALDPARAEQPLAVTVLTAERIEEAGASGLEQVLQQAAGVQLFRRSDARSANPTSQGVTLRALGGNASSRALVLLDGVPQTDPFGGWINWPAYDPLTLAEVRITRGGGAVASGPGALAGTIELTSSARTGLLADAFAGSRSSAEGRIVAGQRLGGGLLSVALHGSRGAGFIPVTKATRAPVDEAADYRNASGRLRWAGPIGREIELQASVSGFVDERARGLPFSDNRSKGADASARLVGGGAWQWSVLGYAQRRQFESSFAATDASRATARRTSLQYDVPGEALGGSVEVRPPVGAGWEVRLGADARFMRGRSDEFGSYVGGVATRDRSSGGRTSHAGAFAEATRERGALLLTAGGRLDRFAVAGGRLTDRVIATGVLAQDVRYPTRSEWLASARAGSVLALTDPLSLRAAAYLGWRPPTLNELFRPFRLGSDATAANPELKPERLRGAEVGVRWQRQAARLDLTLFRNRLADSIANVTLASGPGSFPGVGFVPAGGQYRQRQNLNAITATGVEAGAELTRGPWTFATDASWTRARVAANGPGSVLSGLRPAQTPAFVASASGRWKGRSASAALQLRYVGAQYEDDLNRTRLPAAFTIDGSARWQFSTRLQLVGRVENLLDAQVIAGRTGDGTEEQATPRTLWIGLRLM